MPDEVLTVREFSRWAQQIDTRLANMESIREVQQEHGEDIAVLKDRADRAATKGEGSAIAVIVAGLVTGIVNAFLAFGGSK